MKSFGTNVKPIIVGFAILGAIHAVLKLFGVTAAADWPWLWVVLSPILGALAVCALMVASDAALVALWKSFESRRARDER